MGIIRERGGIWVYPQPFRLSNVESRSLNHAAVSEKKGVAGWEWDEVGQGSEEQGEAWWEWVL